MTHRFVRLSARNVEKCSGAAPSPHTATVLTANQTERDTLIIAIEIKAQRVSESAIRGSPRVLSEGLQECY